MRNLCGVVAPSVVAPSVVALCLAVLVACGSTDSDVVREGGAAAEQPGPDLSAPEDVAEPPAEAERSPSGLASRVLVGGSGTRSPTALDTVRVHYTGWQTDGTRFDSSVARGQPSEFSLNQVIAGWTEGLQLMVEGEKRRLWIPEALAYGGRAGRPAGMLVFDVELLAIVSAAP